MIEAQKKQLEQQLWNIANQLRGKMNADEFRDYCLGFIFYGTSIPTCVLVFKKCREYPEDVLFIDASGHFEKAKNQNNLRLQDIDKIIGTYQQRKEEDKYSHRALPNEIVENDCNLNIPRYVDTFEEEEPVDLAAVTAELK